MAGCCTSCGFAPCRCCGGRFTSLESFDIRRTLVRSLVPCVDQIRDLYTCLGARVYEVSLVRTRWSGGERGVGVEEVILDEPILPTPKIGDLSAMSYQTYSIGSEEVGTLTVSEISARYSEDTLMGRGDGGTEIPTDENFYWEVRIPTSPNISGERRRFVPTSVPNLEPLRFMWTINLARAHQDRSRSGDPRG